MKKILFSLLIGGAFTVSAQETTMSDALRYGIQNLNGSGNGISVTQLGAGKHEFNVIAGTGTTNNGNTITGNQSGGVGADKWFNVNLNGATGATVNVVQDNATTADQASMNIQCLSGTCGTFSYIKH